MLRLGKISELGTGKNLGYARVNFEEVGMVSYWLPLPSFGTKTVKVWQPIEVNSQVACLMDNYCEQGCIAAVLWSATDRPPEWANADRIGAQFADGAYFYYDAKARKLVVEAPESSLTAVIKDADIEASDKVKLKCESLDITGDLNVSGAVTANGEVSARALTPLTKVSLGGHMHPTAATGPPSQPNPLLEA